MRQKRFEIKLTRNTSAQRDENDSSDGIFDSQGTTKVGCNVTNNSCHYPNSKYTDNETEVTTSNICNEKKKT